MGDLFNKFSGSDHTTEILLMSWADKHPYLFTLIKVTEPYLFVIIAVVGINIVNRIFGSCFSRRRS